MSGLVFDNLINKVAGLGGLLDLGNSVQQVGNPISFSRKYGFGAYRSFVIFTNGVLPLRERCTPIKRAVKFFEVSHVSEERTWLRSIHESESVGVGHNPDTMPIIGVGLICHDGSCHPKANIGRTLTHNTKKFTTGLSIEWVTCV